MKEKPSVAALCAFLIAEFNLVNKSHLAREMNLTTSTLGKLLAGAKPLSANQILRIHEWFGVPVAEIRERSGQFD